MAFSAAPEYQVFPTRERPLKPYEAAVLAAQVTREFVRVVRARRRGLGHPHARARAGRRARGRAGGDARPARAPGPAARASRRSRSARGGRARALGARAVAADATGRWRSGSSRAAREFNDCRARLGLAPLPWAHTGLSRSLTMVGDVPAARVPAGLAGVDAGRRAAAVGAGRAARRAAAGRRAGRAGRALDLAGPVAARCCGRAWTGWRTSRCA